MSETLAQVIAGSILVAVAVAAFALGYRFGRRGRRGALRLVSEPSGSRGPAGPRRPRPRDTPSGTLH